MLNGPALWIEGRLLPPAPEPPWESRGGSVHRGAGNVGYTGAVATTWISTR